MDPGISITKICKQISNPSWVVRKVVLKWRRRSLGYLQWVHVFAYGKGTLRGSKESKPYYGGISCGGVKGLFAIDERTVDHDHAWITSRTRSGWEVIFITSSRDKAQTDEHVKGMKVRWCSGLVELCDVVFAVRKKKVAGTTEGERT